MRTRIVDDAAPLSEQKIARSEKALGEPIPSAYRRFLLKHNGGSPEDPHFRMPGPRKGTTQRGAVKAFLGFNTPEETLNLDYALETFRDRIPARMFPIARDPGGSLILLAKSGPDACKVYFWDHEREADDGEPPTGRNLSLIADSLDAFLENLGDV